MALKPHHREEYLYLAGNALRQRMGGENESGESADHFACSRPRVNQGLRPLALLDSRATDLPDRVPLLIALLRPLWRTLLTFRQP